jgi:ribosome-associated toxin RatA of RatAB toxin-antitoxin module
MHTVDARVIAAPPERVFGYAARVERWPAILPHYRWVRLHDPRPDGARLVEMSAYRPFGLFNWPTWWESEMWVDEPRREVRYRHVRGVTRGMDVLWTIEPHDAGTRATIVHEWRGPRWPLIGPWAADFVIGPVFVSGIASRTLLGIARAAEAGND